MTPLKPAKVSSRQSHSLSRKRPGTKIYKSLPLAPLLREMTITKVLAIRIDFTLCRGVQLYPQFTISLAGRVPERPLLTTEGEQSRERDKAFTKL